MPTENTNNSIKQRSRPFRLPNLTNVTYCAFVTINFCPLSPQLEDDKERLTRKEQELQATLEQHRKAAAQAKSDADSAALRHQRELETLQKRVYVVGANFLYKFSPNV